MTAELGSATLRMAGSLVLIIGLILVFVYLLKRYHIGPLSPNRSPVFRLLGTLSLAPKRSIALVEINKQWLVLGVGTERVSLLSKMDRPEEEEVPEDRIDLGSKSFKAMLQDFIAGKRNLIHHDDRRPDEKPD